jgi:RNA polymerase sigma-70 factor (ECF subfamily)
MCRTAPMVDMTRELVRQAIDGSREAFSELMRASAPRQYTIATLILRDRSRAQDAVQEAFVSAWKGLSALREPDAYFGMDGIALDTEGNIYVALVMQNQLVKIDPDDGSLEVLATAEDGLHNPASVAFGTTEGDRSNLYITNYALLPPVPDASAGPAILRYDVGVEGLPLK